MPALTNSARTDGCYTPKTKGALKRPLFVSYSRSIAVRIWLRLWLSSGTSIILLYSRLIRCRSASRSLATRCRSLGCLRICSIIKYKRSESPPVPVCARCMMYDYSGLSLFLFLFSFFLVLFFFCFFFSRVARTICFAVCFFSVQPCGTPVDALVALRGVESNHSRGIVGG